MILNALALRFKAYTPPLGAYAVIGNHEHYAGMDNSLRFLQTAGFTVLRGEAAVTGGIVLAGVDDPGTRDPGHPARLDTRKALESVTGDDFVVLLKHQPVVDHGTPFDLQLSGHVHGGQIFPFVYLTRLIYGVHTGLTRLADGRLLYVSRGAGTWGPPIRLFAPPGITLITIESQPR
jgi:predicted MPP superfamily phosphohydrolase